MGGTVVDLFSGCGGFSLGASQAGFHVVAAVDIDPDLSSSHRLNFANTRLIVDDITTLDLRKTLGERAASTLEGIIGGPPCQGFSVMGKGRTGDPRNLLIAAFFRQVATIQPRFFVMENVKGLLAPGNKSTLDRELEAIAHVYDVHGPFVVDAGRFGAPTKRPRVVIFGFLRSSGAQFDPQSFQTDLAPEVTVRDALADLDGAMAIEDCNAGFDWWNLAETSEHSDYAMAAKAAPPQDLGWPTAVVRMARGEVSGMRRTIHSPAVTTRFASVPPGTRDKVGRHHRLEWGGVAPTIRAGTGKELGSFQSVRPLHPVEPRVITVREGARLQGFPDWFVFHPTIWHSFRMIGNSVSPPMGHALLQAVSSAYDHPRPSPSAGAIPSS